MWHIILPRLKGSKKLTFIATSSNPCISTIRKKSKDSFDGSEVRSTSRIFKPPSTLIQHLYTMTSEAVTTSLGHQNGGPAILAVCITTLALATVFTILRVFVRLRMTSAFWWDDGFLVAATVSLWDRRETGGWTNHVVGTLDHRSSFQHTQCEMGSRKTRL